MIKWSAFVSLSVHIVECNKFRTTPRAQPTSRRRSVLLTASEDQQKNKPLDSTVRTTARNLWTHRALCVLSQYIQKVRLRPDPVRWDIRRLALGQTEPDRMAVQQIVTFAVVSRCVVFVVTKRSHSLATEHAVNNL